MKGTFLREYGYEIIGNIHENPELWEAYNGKNNMR